jgi:hypothetical protein
MTGRSLPGRPASGERLDPVPQVATGTGGTAALTRTYTLTNGASVAVGSLLVVKVGMVGGRLLATPYISSTSANITWTTPPPINANAGGTNGIALVYGRVTGSVLGTDTITLTFSGTAAPAIVVFEYSAGASISAVSTDKSASARAGASTAMNSGTTAALTNADDLVVGHCSFDNGTGTNLITPEVLSPAWTSAADDDGPDDRVGARLVAVA